MHYYNRSYLEGPRFKRGDRVYLSRRNIKTTRLIDKLDFKKIGPFEVEEVIRLVNYKLKLLVYIYINLVFYISLLKTILDDILIVILELLNKNKSIEYKVKSIILYKLGPNSKIRYRIR